MGKRLFARLSRGKCSVPIARVLAHVRLVQNISRATRTGKAAGICGLLSRRWRESKEKKPGACTREIGTGHLPSSEPERPQAFAVCLVDRERELKISCN